MSTTNPNVTTDGTIINPGADWVRYPCASCDRQIEAQQWPDTNTPLCHVCAHNKQVREDRRLLAKAIENDDYWPEDLWPAMARLIIHVTTPVQSNG